MKGSAAVCMFVVFYLFLLVPVLLLVIFFSFFLSFLLGDLICQRDLQKKISCPDPTNCLDLGLNQLD